MNNKYLKEQSRLNNTYRICLICKARKNLKSYWPRNNENCRDCEGLSNKDKLSLITTTVLIKESGITWERFNQIKAGNPNIKPAEYGKNKCYKKYALWDKSLIEKIKEMVKSEDKGETW